MTQPDLFGLDETPTPLPANGKARKLTFAAAIEPFVTIAHDHQATFDRLRLATFAVFRHMATEPSYSRRPPFALRIPVRPDLAAIVRPGWIGSGFGRSGLNSATYTLSESPCIVFEPTLAYTRTDGTVKQYIIAGARIDDDGFRFTSVRQTRLDDYAEAVASLDPFLDDPLGTFQRSEAPNCGICGRKLTDPRSRAQGIGPECIEKIDLLAAMAPLSKREG